MITKTKRNHYNVKLLQGYGVSNSPVGKRISDFDLNGNGGMYLSSGMFALILKNPTLAFG